MAIERGTHLIVTTASGSEVSMRALGPAGPGRDFPVVWVCTETEFDLAGSEGREPDGLPWPLNALRVAEPA